MYSRNNNHETLIELANSQQTHSAQLAEAAKAAVREVGPRVYTIEDIEDGKENFYVFGCQGNGSESQREVAKLMDKIAAKTPDQKPQFILILGDNIYDWGVDSPFDPGFNKCFHDIYGNKEYGAICNIPYFLILGNHDANLHSLSFRSNNPTGEATSINEVAHTYTYLFDEKYKDIAEKRKFYEQSTLNLKDLPQWNMPYFYYSVIAGKTQLFCLDSNFLAKDFLDYLNNKIGNKIGPEKKNQTAWLKAEYEKAKQAGKKIIFALHHPPYTSGKRAFPDEYDSGHYLTQEQIASLNQELKLNTRSYNELIGHIFTRLGLKPDKVLAAHDHFISYYYKNGGTELCQLTCGGGGGDLQTRESFVEHPHVKCHLMKYGFARINKDGVDIHTTAGQHLKFDNNHQIVREKSDDPQVEMLRDFILVACDDYLFSLKELEQQKKKEQEQGNTENDPDKTVNTKTVNNSGLFNSFYSGAKKIKNKLVRYWYHDENKVREIVCVHDIIAYLNQPQLPNFETIRKHLHELADKEKLPNQPPKYPFYAMLQNKLSELHQLLKEAMVPHIGLEPLYDVSLVRSPSPVALQIKS